MKLPSIQSLWGGITRVVKRFPIQFLLAIVATIILWLLIDSDYKNPGYQNELWKILYISNFALTLLLAADLYSENNQFSEAKKWLLRLLTICICAAFYFFLNPWAYNADAFRIFLLAFAFHLLVAFAPFIAKENLNGFWQYNKSLFLGLLTSGFYAGVLYGGLAVALVAIDGLFDVKIDYKIYLKLLAFVGTGFTTIFFLAGIPSNFKALDEEDSYPKGLKIFTQYVLIPLMTIYLAILLVYEIKIVVEWQLPKGLVSTLILGYAVFGILSLLLIHPIRNKEGNGWIRLFSKFFYSMMIPLIALLVLAIVKRVGTYGITESRYILMVLALWLAGITLYFLVSKKQNIKIIPISLAIIALLASYGPQSAFSVSKASQMARLAELMSGKTKDKTNERAEIVRYLVKNHGLTSLQQFTKVNLALMEEKIYAKSKKNDESEWQIKYEKVDAAFAVLKVKDDEQFYTKWVNFKNQNEELVEVNGYDAVIPLNDYYQDKKIAYNNEDIKINRSLSNSKSVNDYNFIITVSEETITFDFTDIGKQLNQLLEAKKLLKKGENYLIPKQLTTVVKNSSKYEFKFVISEVGGNYDADHIQQISNVNGYLLIRKK